MDTYDDGSLGLGQDRPYDRYDNGISSFSEGRVRHDPREQGRLATLLHLPPRLCTCGAQWRTCPDRTRG